MKVKMDYITNSSSTSYLVYIPDNFKVSNFSELFIEQSQDALQYYSKGQILELIFGTFINWQNREDCTIYEYEDILLFSVIVEVFEKLDLIVSSWESGSEDGRIHNLNNKHITKRIDRIRNGGWGIKYGGWGQKCIKEILKR